MRCWLWGDVDDSEQFREYNVTHTQIFAIYKTTTAHQFLERIIVAICVITVFSEEERIVTKQFAVHYCIILWAPFLPLKRASGLSLTLSSTLSKKNMSVCDESISKNLTDLTDHYNWLHRTTVDDFSPNQISPSHDSTSRQKKKIILPSEMAIWKP